MSDDMSGWTARLRPERTVLDGRFVRIEPLTLRHLDGHYDEITVADTEAEQRFAWLPDVPPPSRDALRPWLERVVASDDPMFLAVIDKASGRVSGRQALMRIDQTFGVIEIGHIWMSPSLQKTREATEAIFLMIRHAFDDLGVRRLEWKCDSLNAASRKAAERFGFAFEGIFRQHMIIKGRNRDTAWYAMLDKDWPRVRKAFETWLSPENFDAAGTQKAKLQVA